MLQIQNTEFRIDDSREHQRTLRVRQSDKFEVLVAASEADQISTEWLADRFSDTEKASQ